MIEDIDHHIYQLYIQWLKPYLTKAFNYPPNQRDSCQLGCLCLCASTKVATPPEDCGVDIIR